MILTNRIAHAVSAGEVTCAYRRWSTARVTAGSTFRTVAGVVRIMSVETIDPTKLGTADASAAGFASTTELVATFRGDPADPVFRIDLGWAGDDERDALAEDTNLSPSDVDEITALLDRLDATTPWAKATMLRLADQPGATAAVLAADLPISKESLKRRLRTLKEHGLTRSLPAGYEISARGMTYLSRVRTDRS